jgi:glutathione S-transferase
MLFFAPVVFRLQTYGFTLSPKANQYLEYILALPSIKEWEQQSIEEIWRRPSHEEETLALATITANFR